MSTIHLATLRRQLPRLLPWLLLWVAAPAPLWLALGLSWYLRH